MRDQRLSKNNFSCGIDASTIQMDNIEEIEKSVLDYMISSVDSSDVALNSLHAEDFQTETHRLIFEAIKNLLFRGSPVDLLTIHGELSNTQRPNGDNWVSYLTYILETALPIVEGNIEFHITKLKEASRCRKTSDLAFRVYEAANQGDSEKVTQLLDTLIDLQEDSGTYNPLKPISAKDLPDLPMPESLWGGILYPGCITQLNAEPGAGKSTLLYNIAAIAAQGNDFLGIPFSKPLKTLYIDLESPRWLQKKKIETICEERPENFYLLDYFNLKRNINHLISLAKAKKYDLIVFDTQTKALDMEDENDNAEANRVATLLKKLAMETGAAILLIHHNKKGEGGKDVYRGRGASAIAAAVDIVAILNSQSYGILKLEIVKSRVPGVYQAITIKKVGDDKFERVGTDEVSQGYKSRRVQEFILTLLGDYEEWQTAQILEQAEKEGFKARTVENELRRLVEQGKVIKPRQGIYKLAVNP